MKDFSFKQFIPHLTAIAVFLIIIFSYFSPLLEGKKLRQSDITQWKGMSKEIVDYRAKTGQEPLWTNSMFGGMPAYQISVEYSGNLMRYIDKVMTLGLPHPAGLVFLYFIGFFILLMVLKVDPWLAIAGSLAFAFSSYFFIILEAGHNSKAHAIGYMAPVLAGIILTYRGRLMAGSLLTALFLSLELRANHMQITYYLLMVVLLLGIMQVAEAIAKKTIPAFLKATGVLVVAALLAVATNITNIWATWEYGKETIRGKSELTHDKDNRTSGLDKDYATQWSYGKAESFSLMIPNVKGGGTESLGNNEKAMQKADPAFAQSIAGQNHYWGDQPFTSGPVYVGAIMIFLFILGLFILEGNLRWWLLSATVLSIMLAWGKNFMPLTDFFLHYVPGYNKFRAVSMILVIAELAIPILGILALNEIMKNPNIVKQKSKQFYIALGLTAGLAFIFYLLPQTFFSFLSQAESEAIAQQRASLESGQIAQFNGIVSNLEAVRISIFKSDAIRSFVFILLSAIVLWLYGQKKLNKTVLIVSVTLLIAADLIPVTHRYLNSENFVSKSKVTNPFQPTEADMLIMKDTDPDFRVFNMTVNPFQDASTSYFHKSIGGYHGAKLRRYQELIDNHIVKNNEAVLNMLNTKYFIVPDNQRRPTLQINMQALGHAWFVNDFRMVDNADQENEALNNFDPAFTAIIDKRFKANLDGFRPTTDSTASIQLISYAPNKLVYKTSASASQLAVFSEIYYDKGWNAFIDGKPAPYFRANYVLRSMIIPAGNHEVEFRFEPQVYYTGEKVSFAGSLLLILLLLAYAGFEVSKSCKTGKARSTKA
ncbi:MAG: YfhO family protein [Lentimicrobiaceae bacterium]|nr:YfhO family protein [Lentimicrobiaceae bacterium]